MSLPEINNEKEFIELIKNKNLKEIKEIFKNNNVRLKQWNQFKETLLYLIKKNASFNIIQFILEKQQQQQQLQYQQPSTVVNTELLFYSIENDNFKVAKLFLNNGISIENKDLQSRNILEYLTENKKLNFKNLSFILNIEKNTTLITSELLFKLIKFKFFELFIKIFEYDYSYNLYH